MAYPFLPIVGFNQRLAKPAVPDVFTDYDETNDVARQRANYLLPIGNLASQYKDPLADYLGKRSIGAIMPSSKSGAVPEYKRQPTGVWKLLDYLNRGQYIIMNPIRRLTDKDPTNNNILEGMWKGLTGAERSSFSDVLGNFGWKPTSKLGKFAKFTTSLAGDILLDPTTYLSGGLTKLGKASKLGKIVKIGDKTFDVIKDASKLYNMLDNTTMAGRYLKGVLLKGGIQKASMAKNIARALKRGGIAAEALDLAPSIIGRYNLGQTGLKWAGKKLANMPVVGNVVGMVEKPLYTGLSKLGEARRVAELRAFDKLARNVEPTMGEEIARMIGRIKRGFGSMPEQIKKVRAAASGSGQIHTINQTEKILNILGDINITDPRRIEVLEILSSPRVKKYLPKGWEKGNFNLDDISQALTRAGISQGYSPNSKTLNRLDRILETVKDWRKTDGSINANEIARGARALMETEKANIMSGVVAKKVAEQRGNAEGIGYFTHDLLGSRANTDFRRATHRFQTVWEAQQGILDDEVRKILSEDPERILYEVYDEFGKKMPVTAKDVLKEGVKSVEFDPNLRDVLLKNIERQAQSLEKSGLVSGMLNFAQDAVREVQPLIKAGKISGEGMKPLANLFDSHTLAAMARRNPALVKKLETAMLPTDYWYAAKNIMPFVENPNSLIKVFKKYGDLIKPWLLVSPGFHSRNIISSFLMTHAGGDDLFDPRTYKMLKKVSGILTLDGKLKKTKRLFKIRGKNYTAKELYDEFVRSSGSLGKTRTSLYMTEAEAKKIMSKKNVASAYMAIPDLNRKIGEGIETRFRFAHWLNRLDEGYDPQSAAYSVAKYFYDYGDLAPSERNIQAFVPFYTFLRKNLAANFRYLLENPQYLNFPTKIAQEMNVATQDKAKFPMDWLPDWIKEAGATRLPGGQYARLEGWLPQMDIAKVLAPSKMANTAMEMLHPALKIPYELAANENTFTGRPIVEPGRTTTPFLGLPAVPNKLKHAISWLRPLNELDKYFVAPAMKDYYIKRGAYTPLSQGAGALRYFTGLAQYDYDASRMAMAKYRELTDQMIALKTALRRVEEPEQRQKIINEIDKLKPRLEHIRKQINPILQQRSRATKAAMQRTNKIFPYLGLPNLKQ